MSEEKRIFLSIRMISFSGSLVTTALTVVAPIIGICLHIETEQVSWILAAILIPSAALLLPLGRLSDLYGRQRLYTHSLLMYALTSALAAFTPNLAFLLCCCIGQGIALAGIFVSYIPLLLANIPFREHGKYLGACVSMTYLGLALGPVIGGLIADTIGWRYVFIFAALFSLGAYIVMLPVHREWYSPTAPFVNAISTLLVVPGLLFFLGGLSLYASHPYYLPLGFFLLIAFILHEYRSKHPLLPLFLFKNKQFSFANITAFIQYSATYGLTFLLSLYLQLIHDISPSTTGLILLIQPLLMSLFSTPAGIASDKYGCLIISTLGMLLSTLGLLGFAFIPQCSIPLIIIFLCFTGAGSALFGAPNNKAIMQAVSHEHHSLAASTLALSRTVGQSLSLALVTYILAGFALQTTNNALVLSAALHLLYILFAGLSLLGTIISMYVLVKR